MDNFSQTMVLLGTVGTVTPGRGTFQLHLRTGDTLEIHVGTQTSYNVIMNLDDQSTDRVEEPKDVSTSDAIYYKVSKYVRENDRIYVRGIYFENKGTRRFDAREIRLLHYKKGRFIFEETHWWLTQISRMCDQWLDDLFGDSRSYTEEDFVALYRTNLNILGGCTDDNLQSTATLSRLIYGLSSAYLLTGDDRYREAAAAGVKFQRNSFRNLSHDGSYCFWAYGRRKKVNGTVTILASENPDDLGALPLYEQIYALAGMTQYYRITGDIDVLEDIRRTVRTFNDFFLDTPNNPGFPGHDGYFSHIDPVTMRPDTPALGLRCLRKNWNSVGDHIPAYLVNRILALDPLPRGADPVTTDFLQTCEEMLERVTRLIIEKFPDPASAYVNERFYADWTPDHEWDWQQNRAIIGHNYKIAWNLTRVANYYMAKGNKELADRSLELAERLAKSMVDHGMDKVRGGCFDAVERKPSNGQPIEFVWGATKDFWQQEQAILANLILYGYTGNGDYLDYARDMSACWNAFFLDRDNHGVFFRISDTGMPVIDGAYAQKASYSIAGYHSFELNFLAHIYTRSYVSGESGTDNTFCLYYRPCAKSGLTSFNVLPDFIKPDTVELASVRVNGRSRDNFDPKKFRLDLSPEELGCEIVVVFRVKKDRG